MFSRYAFLIIIGLSFTPLSVQGQTVDTTAQREVIAVDDRRIEALRRADTASLEKVYHDDYTLVTPRGAIRSKVDQLKELASGQFRYETLEVSERAVRVYGDVAILVEREKTKIINAGRQLGGDTRFTRVYKRFGSEWRIIATQGSFIGP